MSKFRTKKPLKAVFQLFFLSLFSFFLFYRNFLPPNSTSHGILISFSCIRLFLVSTFGTAALPGMRFPRTETKRLHGKRSPGNSGFCCIGQNHQISQVNGPMEHVRDLACAPFSPPPRRTDKKNRIFSCLRLNFKHMRGILLSEIDFIKQK